MRSGDNPEVFVPDRSRAHRQELYKSSRPRHIGDGKNALKRRRKREWSQSVQMFVC